LYKLRYLAIGKNLPFLHFYYQVFYW
jgi:hypothetical protein